MFCKIVIEQYNLNVWYEIKKVCNPIRRYAAWTFQGGRPPLASTARYYYFIFYSFDRWWCTSHFGQYNLDLSSFTFCKILLHLGHLNSFLDCFLGFFFLLNHLIMASLINCMYISSNAAVLLCGIYFFENTTVLKIDFMEKSGFLL